MNESVHVVLGHSLGDAFGPVNVDIGVGEVPAQLSVDYADLQAPVSALTS